MFNNDKVNELEMEILALKDKLKNVKSDMDKLIEKHNWNARALSIFMDKLGYEYYGKAPYIEIRKKEK